MIYTAFMYTPAAKKLRKTTFSQNIAPHSSTLTSNSGPVSVYFVSGELTGKERDPETGLYYYGARYLDPRTSRWISADPAMWEGDYIPGPGRRLNDLGGMGGLFNYVNFHVYHYAGNNPVRLVDPDGREFVWGGNYMWRLYHGYIKNTPFGRSVERAYGGKYYRGENNHLVMRSIMPEPESSITNGRIFQTSSDTNSLFIELNLAESLTTERSDVLVYVHELQHFKDFFSNISERDMEYNAFKAQFEFASYMYNRSSENEKPDWLNALNLSLPFAEGGEFNYSAAFREYDISRSWHRQSATFHQEFNKFVDDYANFHYGE